MKASMGMGVEGQGSSCGVRWTGWMARNYSPIPIDLPTHLGRGDEGHGGGAPGYLFGIVPSPVGGWAGVISSSYKVLGRRFKYSIDSLMG